MLRFDIAAVWPHMTFQSPEGALSQNEESEVRELPGFLYSALAGSSQHFL